MFNVDDRKLEYQALEGLSAVAFQQQKYERSRDYLKSALIAVSADSSGQSSAAQQRIFNKLESVMQTKLNQHAVQQTTVCTA